MHDQIGDGGYIKIWRKMLYSEVMKNDWLCRLWLWCLLKASWQDNPRTLRGQFITTRFRGSEELDVEPMKFYKGLLKLEEFGCVTLKSDNKITVVTICKYDTYQENLDEKGVDWTTKGQQKDNKRTPSLIEEEDKEGKEGAGPNIFNPLRSKFPLTLDTPAFSHAWEKLIQMRRRSRWSVRETWVAPMLENLAKFGLDVSILAVEHSTLNHYQGIFPERFAKAGKPSKTEAEKLDEVRRKRKEG